MVSGLENYLPEFSEKAKKKLISMPEGSVALVAADIDYAIKNIDYIVNYSKTYESCENAPILICAIFNSSAIDPNFSWKASVLQSKTSGLLGVAVVDFIAKAFEQDKAALLSLSQSIVQLLINYIKCARFALVQQLWNIKSHDNRNLKIGRTTSLVYVMDFDFVAKDNFDKEITRDYSRYSCILSYNLQDNDGDEKFKKDLCYTEFKPESARMHVNMHVAHKIIKAGFSCFSQSDFADLFFLFFNQYAFQVGCGKRIEKLDGLLCAHYYGDQLSLISAAREIRYGFERNYFDELAWVNIGKSQLINLDFSKASHLYFPKGL